MKLQQLRYICEVARQGLNLSVAAEKLCTSQPGVSKQIRLLEDELGVEIFVRHGKRLVEITSPGRDILRVAERMLRDATNLKNVAQEFTSEQTGSLTIATTHTQARYPGVRLSLRQGSPMQIAEMASSGEADLAIATEAIELFSELVMLPCYEWNRCVVVPPEHPLLTVEPLTLEALARYPIITYDFAFTGRSKINQAFEARDITPNVTLTAIDADVIKTYVELGLGIGIVAYMAFDPERDRQLRAIDASHLFESSTTHMGIRRNTYLRGYMYGFIEMFAPRLTHKVVDEAMARA
ncbi:MAG: HTH-type transcriptional regulator CysB [Burkholderiales bacterium]|nr:HTH-type transcriptional regulator CysB [Burkholderiales bacterium]